MSTPDPHAALERVLAELRAQRPPEPREAALPERLRAELQVLAAQPPSGPRRRARVPSWHWALGAACAAAVALLVLRAGQPQPPLVQPAVSAQATVDARPLLVGTSIEATGTRRVVQHPGRAFWLLEPGSRARLLSDGDVLRVELEQGSLTAHVQPSAQPESFVVQARGTEVAVHGTSFSVALSGERAHVEVSRGSVQVRPAGQRAGTVLDAHMQSDFLAGALLPPPAAPPELPPEEAGARRVPRAAVSSHAAPPPAAPPQPIPSERPPAVAALPPAPAAPPPPDAASARTLQLVTERVQSCFRSRLPGSSELGIQVSTRLGLWVEPSGQLLRADFDPPLAPDIESCVAERLAQFHAAPSPEGYRVERQLVLQR